MKHLFILLISALLFTSCTNTATAPKKTEGGKQFFGEVFTPKKGISTNALLAQMKGKEAVETMVEGEITAVCKKKGCWMTLAVEDGEDIMVRFKDYGFFMPLDLTGNVLIKGTAKEQITTVDELKHYAEDDGASPEEIAEIKEPKREVHITATGVMKL